jgi:hypothetical protein
LAAVGRFDGNIVDQQMIGSGNGDDQPDNLVMEHRDAHLPITDAGGVVVIHRCRAAPDARHIALICPLHDAAQLVRVIGSG